MENDIKSGAKQILASYANANTYKRKQLLELLGIPAVVTNREGMIIDYNTQAYLILGLNKEEISKQNIYELLPAKAVAGIQSEWGVKSLDQVYQLNGNEGSPQLYFVNSYYGEEQAIHFLVSADSSNEPGEALLITEQKYRKLVENAVEGIFIIGLNGFYLVNESLCRIFGYEMDEMLRTDPYSLLPLHEKDFIKSYIIFKIEGRILLHNKIEQVFINRYGQEITCEMSYFSTFYNGEYVIQGHIRDISEVKRVEKELEESEEIYRIVVENAYDNVCIFNDKEVIYANKKLCETIGYNTEELVGQKDFKWVAPEFQRRFVRLMENPYTYKSSVHFHCVLITKQGVKKTFIFTISSTIFKNQNVFIAIGKDISLKREQEKEKRLERRKNSIVNRILRIVAESNSSEKVFLEIIKLLGHEFPSRGLELCINENDNLFKVYSLIDKVPRIVYVTGMQNDKRFPYINQQYKEKNLISQVTNRMEDNRFQGEGYKYYMQLTLIGLDEPFGIFRCAWKDGDASFENRLLTEIILDISIALESFLYREKIARITKEVAQAEKNKLLSKFNLIGEMSTAIAHEVRNPMTTVRGLAQLLKEDNPEQDTYYNVMIDEIDRANNTITEFLSLAKNLVEKKEDYNLLELVGIVFDLMRAEAIMRGINLDVQLLAEDIILHIDTELMKQALMNILQNSIDASTAGDTVQVITSIEGNKFIINIIDEGSGIDSKHIDHVMEPFFTTKHDKAGLGLSVSYKIVQEHGGDIAISSTVNQGTSVKVSLPM